MRLLVLLGLSATVLLGGAAGCAATTAGADRDLDEEEVYEPSGEYSSDAGALADGPGIYFEDVPPLVYVEPNLYVVRDFAYPVYYANDAYWYFGLGVWWCTYTWFDPWFPVAVGYVPWTLHERHHDHYRHYHGDRYARTYYEGQVRRRPPEYYRDQDRRERVGERRARGEVIADRARDTARSDFRGRVVGTPRRDVPPNREARTLTPTRDAVAGPVSRRLDASDGVRPRREGTASRAHPNLAPRRSSPALSAPSQSAPRTYAPTRSAPRTIAPSPSRVRMTSPSSSPRVQTPRSSSPRVSAPRSSSPRMSAPRHSAPRASFPSGGRSRGGGRR